MIDQVSVGEAFARGGMDPRQWLSYGTVDGERYVDGERIDPVIFTSEFGPLVNVTLQPSGLPVRCRVAVGATGAVGNGESEYAPFVGGDEVLVAIPEGAEAGDCAIIGRFNNAIDRFPAESVAGQDPTRNRFAFRRRRTPFIEEFASTWMVRVASHGGFFLISESGNVTLRDGSKGAMQMGPDTFSVMEGVRDVGGDSTPSPTALMQMDYVNRRLTLQMDDAQFILSSSSGSANGGPPAGDSNLSVPGNLTLAFGINQPAEHVASIEFVLACFGIYTGSIAALLPALAALETAITTGQTGLLSTTASALASGLPLAAAVPKPPADPATGVQLAPGLGPVNFKTG